MKAANFERLSDLFSFFSLILGGSALAFFLLFMKQRPIEIKSSPFGNNSVKIEYIENLSALEGGSPAKSEVLEEVVSALKSEKVEKILSQKSAPIQKVQAKPLPQKVQAKTNSKTASAKNSKSSNS